MTIQSDLIDDGAMLRIAPSGRLGFDSHQPSRDAYAQCGAEPGCIVDLRFTESLDMSRLGMLLRHQHAGDGNRVRTDNARPEVHGMHDLVNVGTLFAPD